MPPLEKVAVALPLPFAVAVPPEAAIGFPV